MNSSFSRLRARLDSAPEFLRFGIVAVIGLILDITVAYGASRLLGMPLVAAAALGFACGACINYALHELWTFQKGARHLSAGRTVKYFLSLGATLMVRLGAVFVLERLLGADHALMILILATGLSFTVTYLISKFVVFRQSPSHPASRIPQYRRDLAMTLDDTHWQLPAYEARVYAEKTQDHALVIPVINEGDRIRRQLERIASAGLEVDVIIADGGSEDGSLDPDFIRSLPVRAVLIRTGPGRLSAQLRMAYAWCLREGYSGIITIDGNGKDGVEAVTDFISKLNAGYDYVQGSRYEKGGKAEHTPLERTIANRAIHAPLLSLAGKHWFSDTTNGFRAYSARYLLHPQVQPFRDVFQKYELLFYLTVRAGQLGLKVTQVPVRRSYPPNAAVPTKITGVSGKFDVLSQTFAAALGKFSP